MCATTAAEQATFTGDVAFAAVRVACDALDCAKLAKVHANWMHVLAVDAEAAAAAEAAEAAHQSALGVGVKRKRL
jgi:hypothetical protein